MLAKMWKKILLAVCIIACLFNLTSKLVNRHSLESNLKSANDGNTVLDPIKTEKDDKIDNTASKQNTKTENTFTQSSKNTTVVEEEEETEVERNTESEENQEKDKKTYKYTDFVVTF